MFCQFSLRFKKCDSLKKKIIQRLLFFVLRVVIYEDTLLKWILFLILKIECWKINFNLFFPQLPDEDDCLPLYYALLSENENTVKYLLQMVSDTTAHS